MAAKNKKILLAVSYVDKKGDTHLPGSTVPVPVAEADKMIEAGHAMDPSKIVNVDTLENEAVKAAQAKVAEMQAELKKVKASAQRSANLALIAEKGIQTLTEAVLELDPEAPSLKDSVTEIQERLRAATKADK
jgi:hypothetical protein